MSIPALLFRAAKFAALQAPVAARLPRVLPCSGTLLGQMGLEEDAHHRGHAIGTYAAEIVFIVHAPGPGACDHLIGGEIVDIVVTDRKSVVQGKSEDLGGRRSIKKKKAQR